MSHSPPCGTVRHRPPGHHLARSGRLTATRGHPSADLESVWGHDGRGEDRPRPEAVSLALSVLSCPRHAQVLLLRSSAPSLGRAGESGSLTNQRSTLIGRPEDASLGLLKRRQNWIICTQMQPGRGNLKPQIFGRDPRASATSLYVTLRGSRDNPPWSHDNGQPSRALTMLSLRAEEDHGDRVHDRCRKMLMADDA